MIFVADFTDSPDNFGAIFGANSGCVHRPGYGKLVLDIWTSGHRLRNDPDLHVSNV